MGDQTIPSAVDNTPIPATDHNSLRASQIGDLVPRNSSAAATDESGSIGRVAFRWLFGYIKTIFIGTTADNISLEADSSDLVIKVGGVERARIPQSIGLLPPGMISPYSGVADPAQWFICDGREISRATFARLFTAIDVKYGQGNGTTTFNIPDFRGRFLRGADDPGNGSGAAGRDPGAGARTAMATNGATGNNVGSVQSDEVGPHFHEASPIVGVADVNFKQGATHDVTNPDGFDSPQSGQKSSTDTNSGAESRPKNAYVNYIIKT